MLIEIYPRPVQRAVSVTIFHHYVVYELAVISIIVEVQIIYKYPYPQLVYKTQTPVGCRVFANVPI